MHPLVRLIPLILICSCARVTESPRVSPTFDVETRDLGVRLSPLSETLWLHQSRKEMGPPWGLVDANGGVIFGSKGAVIVDSGWTGSQTTELLDWVRAKSGKEALALIVTHSHDDRAGGIDAAIARGVAVYGNRRTDEILAADQKSRPTHTFDRSLKIDIGGDEVEVYYPGAGHTIDNIVVYSHHDRVLFGGCLIRALSSENLGYTGEADIAAWPDSITHIQSRFPAVERVVPGHGNPGGTALFRHTRKLAAPARTEIEDRPPR